ncbi:MAG: signal peptidase I [Candidatus Omnitrophica bacterium]|nr:signal peptidase I [Candidatus Omnitrophota bacterium]
MDKVKAKEKVKKSVKKEESDSHQIREWIESFIIAFILAMIIRTFVIQPFKIPSGSMIPTLIEKDRLMVNKLRYGPKIPFTNKRLPGFGRIQRGDVIVFVYPVDNRRDFIKRLIAFGGDTIEIKNGDVFINDHMIVDPVIKNIYYYNNGQHGLEDQRVIVPEGNVFVLGDNSAQSSDSRFWGFVPVDNIVGRAEFIYWPLKRVRWIK